VEKEKEKKTSGVVKKFLLHANKFF